MVVHAALQRLQQGGLSVETSADNQGNTQRNAHAGNRSAVREIEGDA